MTDGIRERQKAETRRALLAESRRLFATRGYAAVGLAEIVRTVGLTKGALYHHFASKEDLFRAVLAQVQEEVAEQVAASADAGAGPWARFVAGCEEFLTASTDPSVRRIMLIDGPAVLGWAEWRALDDRTSARHLAEALDELMAAKIITRQPVEPLTRLLSGAMNEAALWLAEAPGNARLTHTKAALGRLLVGLLAD